MNKHTSKWFNRIHFIFSVLLLQNKNCPYCFSKKTIKIGKNAYLGHVRECRQCSLIYRWPKQNVKFNQRFYQIAYSRIHRSPVTDLPSKEEVASQKACNFDKHPKDFSQYVMLMKELGCTYILDYGCSWGYGVFQFQNAEFQSVGLEVSSARAAFGRQSLGVPIVESQLDIIESKKKFDCIFSSHVLEHLPSPIIAFKFFEKVIQPGGWLLFSVPNCSGTDAIEQGVHWGPFSSYIHPLSFTEYFFRKNLPKHHFNVKAAFSRPFNSARIGKQIKMQNNVSEAVGYDLVVVAKYEGS